ncbi:MAG: hypothetical protein CMJ81_18300 [Planctomycetaceae bacterium]|nr:hypothetical protein [Planctomycetaceae bacterium]MBP61929.1 hypothetical protein [Planctomycetaceae bacterium]
MPLKSHLELKQLGSRMMLAAGAQEPVAQRVVEHLVESNLVGIDSHGIIRLPDYISWLIAGKAAGDNRLEVLQDRDATCLVDAHFTYGAVAGSEASRLAAEKARRHGVGMVSVKNSTHTGRIGEYVEHLAADGLIGFFCCNAQGYGQFVAPWGGKEARLTTNPLAWGFPSGQQNRVIVVDMATSAAPEGRIRLKSRRGESIPPGQVIDAKGRDTSDPQDLFGPPPGAILPFGQHKGYALALVVEMLSGALSGGGCLRPVDQKYTHENSFFVLAIDIESVRPLVDVSEAIDNMLDYVTGSAPIADGQEVLFPYEREQRERQHRKVAGIEVEQPTWNQIVETAESLGVAVKQ